jgi:predicted RNA binding protein YcfA (HicA-like mRNA interferase family)
MRTSPGNDWRIEDLKALANRFGIDYRQPGTSHVTFRTQDGRMLTVPSHKPIKAIYIKKFLELVSGIDDSEGEN